MLVKISGAAGCGKTTLAHKIKEFLFAEGKTAIIIEEGETVSDDIVKGHDAVILCSIVEK